MALQLDVPSIQVKDVPDDVHAVLRARAAAAGKSLQEYLLGRLVDEGRRPTVEEVLAHASNRAGGKFSAKEAVAAVHAGRRSR